MGPRVPGVDGKGARIDIVKDMPFVCLAVGGGSAPVASYKGT